MLVDGVEVFANDVESYGICKELYLVRERRQTWKAHSLMMGLVKACHVPGPVLLPGPYHGGGG